MRWARQLIHSSVWSAPNHVRLVWITMLGLSDDDGIVRACHAAIARMAGVTRTEVDEAIAWLAAPDPYNSTIAGEKIRVRDDGWRVEGEQEWFTYAMQIVGADYVKIGRSNNPTTRLSSIQNGSPFEIRIIWSTPGDIERQLHDRFAHLRIRGEWFRLTSELTSFFAGDSE